MAKLSNIDALKWVVKQFGDKPFRVHKLSGLSLTMSVNRWQSIINGKNNVTPDEDNDVQSALADLLMSRNIYNAAYEHAYDKDEAATIIARWFKLATGLTFESTFDNFKITKEGVTLLEHELNFE